MILKASIVMRALSTEFKAQCGDLEQVNLTAPMIVSDGAMSYDFYCWVVNGAEKPVGMLDLQVTMDDDFIAVAVYQSALLGVQSDPIPGIEITGTKPGTTAYTATCYYGQQVSLAAPVVASPTGVRYSFQHWRVEGVDMPAGQDTIEVLMDAEKLAVAVYSVQTHTLSVQASPISNVEIGGTKPGTTNYAITCTNQESVDLSAPGQVVSGGRRYNFVRWRVNGAEQPAGQTDLHLIIAADSTVVAAYEVQHYDLTVKSAPVSGFSIGGNKPGTTGYSAVCQDQEIVNLSVPEEAIVQGTAYAFLRWIVDGTDQPEGQTGIQLAMSSGHVAEAVFSLASRTLTVCSMPVSGVAISGSRIGITDYSQDCVNQEPVTLVAPSSAAIGGRVWHFLYWLVDGQPKPRYVLNLALTMDTAHTAIAVYDWTPPGDLNGDCRVNVLDLIQVRNRLGTRCSQ